MGDRANIELVYSDDSRIFLYTHWQGSELPEILRNALIRGRNRWGDDSYLARIIFSEMIKDEVLEETDYGLSPFSAGDAEHDVIVVNLPNQTVYTKEWGTGSFEDYVT